MEPSDAVLFYFISFFFLVKNQLFFFSQLILLAFFGQNFISFEVVFGPLGQDPTALKFKNKRPFGFGLGCIEMGCLDWKKLLGSS